jgi:hypothetical protein
MALDIESGQNSRIKAFRACRPRQARLSKFQAKLFNVGDFPNESPRTARVRSIAATAKNYRYRGK